MYIRDVYALRAIGRPSVDKDEIANKEEVNNKRDSEHSRKERRRARSRFERAQ